MFVTAVIAISSTITVFTMIPVSPKAAIMVSDRYNVASTQTKHY